MPPLCRETQSLGQQMLEFGCKNATVGKNGLRTSGQCGTKRFKGMSPIGNPLCGRYNLLIIVWPECETKEDFSVLGEKPPA